MDLFPGMPLLWFWGWELCSGLCPSRLPLLPQCQVALVAAAWRWLSCLSLAAAPFD